MILTHQTPYGLYHCTSAKPAFAIQELIQNHSAIIHPNELDGKLTGDGWKIGVNATSTLIPVIKTADCLGLFLVTETEEKFLLHAGWRGLTKGMVSQIKNIKYALIGPYIQAVNYEVGREFLDYFKNSSAITSSNGKYYFDLGIQAEIDIKLHSPKATIINLAIDTFSSKDWHSHRREASNNDRNYHFVK